MKFLLILLAFFGFSVSAKADQLAYLSKSDADRAAEYIKAQEFIYLYCGCCDVNETPSMIAPISVEVRFTNYMEFYEVVVTYLDETGSLQTFSLELAYTWVKQKKKMKTVGSVLELDHDPCHAFPKNFK